MKVKVTYLGVLRYKTGKAEEEYELCEGSTLKDLLLRVAERYPSLKDIISGLGDSPADPTLIAALNGLAVRINESGSTMLEDGDTITLMTVIGGG